MLKENRTEIEELMREYRVDGLSIARIEGLKIAETAAYGVRNRAAGEAMDEDTIFQAASVSKPVFAVGVMRLVEQGLLDLDKDIAEYLGDFTVPTFDGRHHRVTLRQILSHNAGLSIHGFAGYETGDPTPTVEEIILGKRPANNLPVKLVKEPQSGVMYSGGGIMLAQKIVQDVTGENFGELMDRLVLKPFGMTHSAYSQPLNTDKYPNYAHGYNWYDKELTGGFNTMPELAAAGLWSNPSDLCRLGIGIMRAMEGDESIITRASAAALTTKAFDNTNFAIGFVCDETERGALFGHTGSNFGYRTYMMFCPKDGRGVVIMQNSEIGDEMICKLIEDFEKEFGWEKNNG